MRHLIQQERHLVQRLQVFVRVPFLNRLRS